MDKQTFSQVTKLGDFITSLYVPMVQSYRPGIAEAVKMEIESFLVKVAQEHFGNTALDLNIVTSWFC